MNLNYLNRKSSPFVFIWALTAAVFISLSQPQPAQGDWWQKGKSLLETLSTDSRQGGAPTAKEIEAAFKEALRIGTETVVGSLGKLDGFNTDPAAHIALPQSLQTVKEVMEKFGMSSLLTDLELKLNRAAEAATPKAKKIFYQAIEQMSLKDVQSIYKGPNDAATRYFKDKMSGPLAREMRPVVEDSLASVGALKVYENITGKYRALPFVPDIKSDLTGHVIDKGLEGLFYYLAREEAAIRENPAKRTTELLKRVFGSR